MAELVTGLFATFLFFVTAWFGWDQIKRHGRTTEERDRAIRERDEAIRQARQATRPPITGRDSVSILRRLRDDRRARKGLLPPAEHKRD